MRLTWIETYLDTLIGGDNVDEMYGDENAILVAVDDDALNHWIASETDFKNRRDFDENYTCDDTDKFIREMQDTGGEICVSFPDIYELTDEWDNGKLEIHFVPYV